MKAKLPPIPCEGCGTVFEPAVPTQRFHKESCLKRAYRHRRALRTGSAHEDSPARTPHLFWTVLQKPTLNELFTACCEFASIPTRQRIFVGTIPDGFELPFSLEIEEREDKHGWHISQPLPSDNGQQLRGDPRDILRKIFFNQNQNQNP